MPRANRYWLPGHVWHLTQRCHRRQFLLRFGRDRRLWTSWLYEARVRHGLCVLDYTRDSRGAATLADRRPGGAGGGAGGGRGEARGGASRVDR